MLKPYPIFLPNGSTQHTTGYYKNHVSIKGQSKCFFYLIFIAVQFLGRYLRLRPSKVTIDIRFVGSDLHSSSLLNVTIPLVFSEQILVIISVFVSAIFTVQIILQAKTARFAVFASCFFAEVTYLMYMS